MELLDKLRSAGRADDDERERLEVRTRLEDALAPYLGTELFVPPPPKPALIDLRAERDALIPTERPPLPALRRRRSQPLRVVRD